MNFNAKEILAAAPDAVAIAAGAAPANPHPLASSLTLRQIATACAGAARPGEVPMATMGRGIASADFARVLAGGMGLLAVASYDAQAAEHLAFTTTHEAKNFQPVAVLAAEATGIELELLGQNAEIARGTAILADGPGEAVQLRTFARLVGVTRQAVVNDDLGAIARFIAGLGTSAARLEADLLAQALESAPAMADGLPAFDVAHDNIVASALSGPALGQAMALLRTQKTAGGQLAAQRARHLVVAPDLEFTARGLLNDTGLANTISVGVLAPLPAGRWYALADPATCPVLAVLRLQGARQAVAVEQRLSPDEHADGSFIAVRCDTGAHLLRRTGIVRGGL